MGEIIFENDFIEVYSDESFRVTGLDINIYEAAVLAEEFVNFIKHRSDSFERDRDN